MIDSRKPIYLNWYIYDASCVKIKRGRRRNQRSHGRPFCGLFQNPRGSIAASTTIDHSRVTSAANVIRGRTPWQGIYARVAACCRNTIVHFAAGNSGARIISYATRTMFINRKLISFFKMESVVEKNTKLLENAIPTPEQYKLLTMFYYWYYLITWVQVRLFIRIGTRRWLVVFANCYFFISLFFDYLYCVCERFLHHVIRIKGNNYICYSYVILF